MSRFRWQLTLRLALLLATMFVALWLWLAESLLALPLLLVGLLLLQVALLFQALARHERWLSRFFKSLRYDDFTSRFQFEGQHDDASPLAQALEEVMVHFRDIRADKEASYRYLEAVIHHLGVPTLTIQDHELIHLSNPAAKRLFDRPRFWKLSDLGPPLAGLLREIGHGEQLAFRYQRGDETIPLLISATRFHLRDHHYLLVSFQNIRREVEQAETEAWQRLTRVLRHEILNSLTPVTTLARTLEHMLFVPGRQELRPKESLHNRQRDIQEAVQLIQRRSAHLMQFVQTYREVTKLPQPQWEAVELGALLDEVTGLFRRRFEEAGIRMHLQVLPRLLPVQADPSLVEQVLINLLLNASEALQKQGGGDIWIDARRNSAQQPEIVVRDNGPGVPPELAEDIFTPFFTTKEEGQGIGLSVSRQIMQAHGGELLLLSQPGEGASFLLRLA